MVTCFADTRLALAYLEDQRFFGDKFIEFKAVIPFGLPTNDTIPQENRILQKEKKIEINFNN